MVNATEIVDSAPQGSTTRFHRRLIRRQLTCGIYRQFQRKDIDVFKNVALLYERKYGKKPSIQNVPTAYLLRD